MEMTEKEKREKAIKGLKSIHGVAVGDGAFYVTECSMGDFNRLLSDSIALLKAQEPITGETSDGYHTRCKTCSPASR